jgi:hypothetical protein
MRASFICELSISMACWRYFAISTSFLAQVQQFNPCTRQAPVEYSPGNPRILARALLQIGYDLVQRDNFGQCPVEIVCEGILPGIALRLGSGRDQHRTRKHEDHHDYDGVN